MTSLKNTDKDLILEKNLYSYDWIGISRLNKKNWKKWWNNNKDGFYFHLHSSNMCRYCHKYFLIWWDSNKFDWFVCSSDLCTYCYRHFNIWWDPEKFNWKFIDYLCVHCHKNFFMWWNPKKMKKDRDYIQLRKHCKKFKKHWMKEYMIYTLTKGRKL